jgi:bifunctional UDP-N-acetylglucosamine pyrophosphorylase/glucosamine-1-phosphate N-acetyltransferase
MAATAIVILAAGKGTRMRSDIPKVLHPLAGQPMIAHVLRAAAAVKPVRVVTVVAADGDKVRRAAEGSAFAVQAEQLGTGHAVNCAREALAGFDGVVLILFGDTPLVRGETLARIAARADAPVNVVGVRLDDSTGYGRLIVENGALARIVECRDADVKEKAVTLCNSGVMAVQSAHLFALLDAVTPAKNGEYYLTDIVAVARARGLACNVVEESAMEFQGINTKAQLAEAEATMQKRLRAAALEQGVTLVAPETVFMAVDTAFGRDVVVQPNVVFGPGVTIGDRVEIRSFSHIEGAQIGSDVIIGPFARLRPGTQLADQVHIGNFVELKQSQVAQGAKINHLSYVGDASVGAGANVGAGTITCNYDGYMKHRTTIGAGAFIGSNSSLVAPVSVGEGAIVGAGSVVTEDVPPDALTIERAEQTVKEDGAKRWRERQAK